jgi:hypothetical protein
MDRSEQARTVVAGVWHHRNMINGGDRKHVTQRADASHLGRARLNKIHRLHREQALELHQRGHVLAGRDRDSAGTSQFGQTGEIGASVLRDEVAVVDVTDFSLLFDVWLVHRRQPGNLRKALENVALSVAARIEGAAQCDLTKHSGRVTKAHIAAAVREAVSE